MATNTKRTVQLKLMVTPELHANLQEVAAQYGQPVATLASVFLGSAVANARNSLNASQNFAMAVGNQLANQLTLQAVEASK